jgi:hypothetical protein
MLTSWFMVTLSDESAEGFGLSQTVFSEGVIVMDSKKHWILGLVTCGVILGGCAMVHGEDEEKEEKEVKVKIEDVPAPVKATLLREADGQEIKTVDLETLKGGKTVYEADVKIDGTNYEINVAPDGKLISKKIDNEEDEKKGKDEEKEEKGKDKDKD